MVKNREINAYSLRSVHASDPGGVAQSVRACGSYPQCPGFKSLHRHFLFNLSIQSLVPFVTGK